MKKSLSEVERLRLLVAKQEVEIARLKKGYWVDGLGCINDYVENQHFNTIIVANEKAIREQEANKLESDKIAIGYAEIKEKVVERQLAFQSEVPVKQDELRSNPTS